MRILKFLCSGLIGITVNLGTLEVLVSAFDIHYLTASILAVSVSTVVGFLLQKYWTFSEPSSTRAPGQFALYVTVAVANIFINTAIVYMLVEWGTLPYLVAQAVGAAVVAVSSYILYQKIIFRARPEPSIAP